MISGTTPKFYITARQPPRPLAMMLAVVVAAGGLSLVALGLHRSAQARLSREDAHASRDVTHASSGSKEDEKDDPSQIDTIVLGDAADAPEPARPGEKAHYSEVHPTIMIRLPRYGDQFGLIPDSPAGHLLYDWLAAFNQTSAPAMEQVLPNEAAGLSAAAQMELRKQTGGFSLLSAKEVQPGLLVFRLRDQTPDANEVLGTLLMRTGSDPAAIASLSLRAVPSHGVAAH